MHRHHPLFINQRMTGIFQIRYALGVQLGTSGFHLVRQVRLGKDQVQPHSTVITVAHALCKSACLCRQLKENALHLFPLPAL